jgi:hypothetical protein
VKLDDRHAVSGSPSTAANGRPDGSLAPTASAYATDVDAVTPRIPR